jgi:CubicO group peptidase (beta-lactamase class C family)
VRDILTEYPYLPESITLVRLATHTSGLPRLPSNILWSVLRNPRNPYAHYTAERLHAYLSHYKRRQGGPSSFPYTYSNLGVGLLGYALARRLGISYEQAIQERINTPLNLFNTGITLTPSQHKHLVTPHTEKGKATPLWDLGPLAGAGSLRSNISDMLTFLETHLGRHSTVLTSILPLCHQIYVKKDNTSHVSIALGWHLSPLNNTSYQAYWHNGSTGGCMAFVGFVKECNAGVVILSNYGRGRSGGTDITQHGLSLLNLICGH